MDMSIPPNGAAGTQQAEQDWPATWPEEFGCLVLAAAVGADSPQQAVDQLPGITWFDPHTGVSKDRALPADQVPAREARLIACDLNVRSVLFDHVHQHITHVSAGTCRS